VDKNNAIYGNADMCLSVVGLGEEHFQEAARKISIASMGGKNEKVAYHDGCVGDGCRHGCRRAFGHIPSGA
jgi:hypothetical protein